MTQHVLDLCFKWVVEEYALSGDLSASIIKNVRDDFKRLSLVRTLFLQTNRGPIIEQENILVRLQCLSQREQMLADFNLS